MIRCCIDRVVSIQSGALLRGAVQPESPSHAVTPAPIKLALEKGKLWKPGTRLRLRFLDGKEKVKARVRQYALEWTKYANLEFDFTDDPEAEIRISFIADPGSWSYIGTDALTIAQNAPTVNFGWLTENTPEEEYARVVIHEIGHTLGCIHEHQNPTSGIPWNKPAVYRFYSGPPNFWSLQQVDRNILQKYSQDQTQFTEFDRQSIMLYPVPRELTIGGYEVGWNRSLSITDRGFIAACYPLQDGPIKDLEIDGTTLQVERRPDQPYDVFRFLVEKQDTYTIQTEGYLDTYMTLLTPNSKALPLAEDDDSGPGLNPRISKDLEPGAYYLRIRHYRMGEGGRYGISVRSSSPGG